MNDYYTKTFNALPDTLVRSAAANDEYLAVEVGFDRAQVKLRAALRAPDGEVIADFPAASLRANKSFVFDSTGLVPVMTVTASSAEMTAAVAAASAANASAIAAAASAATVAGSTNALHLLQLNAGIL